MTLSAPQRRASWHDAYDAQMALWRWYRTEQGRAYVADDYQRNVENLEAGTREMLLDLYGAELARLIDCDPIYVSAEMCELVDAARVGFEPEPLMETDIVTTRGFMLYEQPFLVPDRFEHPVTIHAASWTRMLAVDDPEHARLVQAAMMQLSGDPAFDVRGFEELAIEDGAMVNGIALTLYATAPAVYAVPVPVMPFHITPWYFGMTFDGNEVDENGEPTGAAWWWKIVQTTFRLMQQRIAVRHLQRPDRSTRREAARLHFADEAQVVVVRLRREESEHEPPGEVASYSHRFIVNGHWRNQWYPSISAHRQIWISPYVKGDPGLPLIVKPRRVFQWNR